MIHVEATKCASFVQKFKNRKLVQHVTQCSQHFCQLSVLWQIEFNNQPNSYINNQYIN